MTDNPQSYVKNVPLAIPSHRGIAIQARNQTVYNATIPTRDEIRRENYQRREQQYKCQGFQSAINKPYKPIGEPICLKDKKLILSSLGQPYSDSSSDSSSSDESGDAHHQRLQWANLRRNETSTIDKTHVKLMQNDVSDLQKEVRICGKMVEQVKKGHSVFKLVLKEQQDKLESEHREMLRKRELRRTQMRPPRFDSDSEDDDQENDDLENCKPSDGEFDSENVEDFINDNDAELTQNGGAMRPFSTGVIDGRRRVVFHTDQKRASKGNTSSKNPSRVGSSKHLPVQRPYTPQHSNIAASELNTAPDKTSLFRQLCILYWLLDTMNANPERVVRPIASCWNAKELMETDAERNRRMNTERTKYVKQELNWKQFISGTADKEKKRRSSPTRVRGYHHYSRPRRDATLLDASAAARRRESLARRESVTWHDIDKRRDSVLSSRSDATSSRLDGHRPLDASSTCSDSQSSIGQLVEDSSSKDDAESMTGVADQLAGAAAAAARTDVDPDAASSDADALPTGNGMVQSHSKKPTGDMPMSPTLGAFRRRSSSAQGTITTSVVSKTPTFDEAKSPALLQKMEEKKLSRREKILNKINRVDAESRWQRPKDELSGFRATAQVKPKKTASVIEFESNAASIRFYNMPQTMQNKFHEVIREKEHALNDKLEAIFRDRMRKIENKYAHNPTEACVDVALQAMRARHLEDVKARKKDISKNKKIEIYHKWYTELMQAIPDDIKNSWYCEKIMDKLGKYGLVEAGKQSAIKLQRVLTLLRPWELCSPDVSAAIEFCRQRVVEMPVDEYEKWFSETFPNIVRPPIAPPVESSSNVEVGSEWRQTNNHGQSRAATRSAPPRLRQVRN